MGDHLWDFGWRLKVDRVSLERMCAGREFQVEGAYTEKAQEEKLLVILAGLVRRLITYTWLLYFTVLNCSN